VREKQVKYLTIIQREVESEEDQKTDGETVYKQILINSKLQTGETGQNTAEWEKSIQEARVRVGL